MSGVWNKIWSMVWSSESFNSSDSSRTSISNVGDGVGSGNVGSITNINLNNTTCTVTAGTVTTAATTYTSLVPNGGYSVGVNVAGTLAGNYTWPNNFGNYNVISNTGALYPNTILGTNSLQQNITTSAITINGSTGTALSIYYDGRVEWTGPLSKNAEAFVNAVSFNIDKNAAGENALARSYRKAIERCLRQIKTMSKEEFIAMLETEVEARMSKAVLMALMEEASDDE